MSKRSAEQQLSNVERQFRPRYVRLNPIPRRPGFFDELRDPGQWIVIFALTALLLSAIRTATVVARLDTVSRMAEELFAVPRSSVAWITMPIEGLLSAFTFEGGVVYLLSELFDRVNNRWSEGRAERFFERVLMVVAVVLSIMLITMANASAAWSVPSQILDMLAGVGVALLGIALGELGWRRLRKAIESHQDRVLVWRDQVAEWNKKYQEALDAFLSSSGRERREMRPARQASLPPPVGSNGRWTVSQFVDQIESGDINIHELFARCNTAQDLKRHGYIPSFVSERTMYRAWEEARKRLPTA